MADAVVSRLVERESELAQLNGALERATDGAGSLILIEGEAGVGRSRLVRAAGVAAADHGFSVMSAFGDDNETDMPFGIVRQLLGHAVATLPAGECAGTTPAVNHGLYLLVADLAERRPVLLAVDDAQWSDAASLRFMLYLTRRLAELPVVLVMSVRRGDTCADQRCLLELAAASATAVLTPAPLTVDGTAALLSLLANPAAAGGTAGQAFHQATGGNPFLLTELAGALAAARPGRLEPADNGCVVPPAVVRSVRLRLNRLGPDPAALAKALAVLGEGTELRLLASYLDVGMDVALTAMADLVRSSILAESRAARFNQPMVRDAIVSDLSEVTRAAMHRRAANLLIGEDVDPELVAGHLLASPAGGSPASVRLLQTAAVAARDRGAVATAARYLARALQEPPLPHDRGQVLAELGIAELLNVDPAAAVGHLRAGYDLAVTSHERAQRALPLARAEAATGSVAGAIRLLEESIPGLDAVDGELALRLAGELASQRNQHRPGTGQLPAMSAGFAGDTSGERAVLASLARQELQRGRGPASSVAGIARRALGGESLLHDVTADNAMYYQPGLCLVFTGHPHEAAAAFAKALADARARGSAFGSAAAYAHLALAAYQHGAVRSAEDYGRSAWEAALRLDPSAGTIGVITLAAREYVTALTCRGQARTAQDVLVRAFELATAPTADLLYARAGCHSAAGNAEDARQDLCNAVELAGAADGWDSSFPWRGDLALALSKLGKDDEALTLAERQLVGARRWGTAGAIGSALRVLAVVHRDEAIPLLEEAVGTLRPASARLEQARALVELGVVLCDRDQAGCLEHLREGRDLAHLCGAGVLERRAHSMLRDAGARPRQPMDTGVPSLTASERRVAEYAARGASNRQIAQALFVTTKTVESHLASTYRKLGISSRATLRIVLASGDAAGQHDGDLYYCAICRTPLPASA